MTENFIIAALAGWALLCILFAAEGCYRAGNCLLMRCKASQQRPAERGKGNE